MKKVFLAVACIAFVASMASCKKDCRCISKLDGIETSNMVVGQMSKSDCEAYKMATAVGVTFECKAE